MRVLIVSTYALPHVGGIQTLVDQEVRALVDEGHQVTLLTTDAGGIFSPPSYPEQVRVIRVRAAHWLERRFHIFYPLCSARLLPLLWRETRCCDVIHIHGLVFMLSLAGVLLGRLRGKPCIVTEHLGDYCSGSRVASLLARWLTATGGRFTARLATRLVGFSPPIVRMLSRLAGCSARVVLLPKPVDLFSFHPSTRVVRSAARARLGWQDSRPKVLFVGRLIPDKGVRVLLQAADPRYDLIFCGPGDRSVVDGVANPQIRYLSPRPPLQLPELYHAADLLIVPSIREGGLPLVALEALGCGLPVVLANYPGAELYQDIAGITLCDRNPAALQRAILNCIHKPGGWDCEEIARGLAGVTTSPRQWVRALYEPFGLSFHPGDRAIPGDSAYHPLSRPIHGQRVMR